LPMIFSFDLNAGQEKFIYKGHEVIVKTKSGSPVTVGDTSNVVMEEFRPVIVQDPKTGICDKFMEIKFLVFEKGVYLVEISTDEDSTFKHIFYVYYLNDKYPVIGTRTTMYIGNITKFPELWKWQNKAEITWMPFRFSFTKIDMKTQLPVQPKKEYIFTQWVKFKPEDVKKLASMESEFIVTWNSRRTTYELFTQVGRFYRIPLLDGLPELEDREILKIESIEPIVGMLGANKNKTPAWLAIIHWKDKSKTVTIEISDLQGEFKSNQIRLNKDSIGKIYFGIQDKSPSLWTWEKEQGDSWVPFQFRFTTENGEVSEFIQWIKLTQKIKQNWAKLK